MHKYDPYTAQHVPNEMVASVVAGRHVARIYWHAQQAFLLGGNPPVEPPYDLANRDRDIHWRLAFQVYDSLVALAFSLDVEDVDSLTERINSNRDRGNDELLSEDASEAMDEATNAQERGTRSYDVICSSLVKRFVEPIESDLKRTLMAVLRPRDQAYFRLGEFLERGICRRDAYRFLRGPMRGQLRPDAVSESLWKDLAGMKHEDDGEDKGEDEGEDNWETDDYGNYDIRDADEGEDDRDAVVGATERSRGNFPFCFASREPGDLAPHSSWFGSLKAVYNQIEEMELDLEPLEKLLVTPMAPADFSGNLLEAVERVFCDVWTSLAPESDPDPPRLVVSQDYKRVTLDGVTYPVDKDAGYVFAARLEADWDIPFKRICKEADGEFAFLMGYARLERIKKRLHPDLSACLISKKGHSMRLKLPPRPELPQG